MHAPSSVQIEKVAVGIFTAFVSLFLFTASPAHAAGCPTTAVSENGGKHICYSAGDKDNVHVWWPDTFDANAPNAATVVYAHGHSGFDENLAMQKTAHFVDRVWDYHDLSRKFSQSGLNAVFVAVEGPVANGSTTCPSKGIPSHFCTVRWTSLGSLLSSLDGNITAVKIPRYVVGVGHSAGMFTIERFVTSGDLKHVISLDSMYGSVPSDLDKYSKTSGARITLAGGSAQNSKMKDFVASHEGFVTIGTGASSYPTGLDDTQKSAPFVWFNSSKGHMDLVRSADVIPLVLSRVRAGSGVGTQTSTGSVAASKLPISVPELEIKIPFVDFSEALSEPGSGEIIAPWIGEYISGLYRFLLSIVGVIAAVFMVIGGFGYVTAGGSAERVQKARSRIINALTGLILAFGSYVILYTINPSLVTFEALKFRGVTTDAFLEATDEGGLISASDGSAGTTVSAEGFPPLAGGRPTPVCAPNAKGGKPMSCEDLCRQPRSSWPKTTPGAADPAHLVDIGSGTGFTSSKDKNRGQTLDSTRLLIVEAGKIAADPARLAAIGVTGGPYRIHFSWGYRPVEFQIQLACDNMAGVNRGTIARPGGSLHGAGWALDTQLWRGNVLVSRSGGSRSQHHTQWREGAINLAKIMFAAGFRRVQNEIWHFEPKNAPDPGCRCASVQDCGFPARPNSRFMQAYNECGRQKKSCSDLTSVKSKMSPIGCGKNFDYDYDSHIPANYPN